MSSLQKISLFFFFIVGLFVQITPVIRSGWSYDYGIGYWGPSGHDSVWHLSLINAIDNPISIDMPIFSGEKLVNYHPLFNILISYLSKITLIPTTVWLFQISPILLSTLILIFSYLLGKIITRSHSGGILLLLLNSLANSLGPLANFFRYGEFQGESIFWAMQSPSNQINPPYSLSLVLLLLFLILIYNNSQKYLFFLIILILLPVTKAYSAIIGFSIYLFYGLWQAYSKKIYLHLITLVISLILSASFFKVYNPQPQNLLVFQPFWFINSIIDSPDKFYLPKVSSLRQTLESTDKFDIRLPLVYCFSLGIFIVGNYGFRLLGLLSVKKIPIFFHISLMSNIIILTLIPIFFTQKGTSWNTIQFIYYALFLSNIYLAVFLKSALSNKFNKLIVLSIFIYYTVAFFGSISNYIGGDPPAYLPKEELKALNFLRQQPKGTVLTVPYDKYIKDGLSAPVPLYAYETTSYVSAYSHQPVFMEDEMNLNNSGYNFELRRKMSSDFFSQRNVYEDRGFLVNNQISYIYLTGVQINRLPLNTRELFLTPIFNSSNTVIYQVQR